MIFFVGLAQKFVAGRHLSGGRIGAGPGVLVDPSGGLRREEDSLHPVHITITDALVIPTIILQGFGPIIIILLGHVMRLVPDELLPAILTT